jgi:hypothetical protein
LIEQNSSLGEGQKHHPLGGQTGKKVSSIGKADETNFIHPAARYTHCIHLEARREIIIRREGRRKKIHPARSQTGNISSTGKPDGKAFIHRETRRCLLRNRDEERRRLGMRPKT